MEKEFDFKNIGKRMPYRTPDGFFGKMQKQVLERTQAERFNRQNRIKLIIGATLAIAAVMLGVLFFRYLNLWQRSCLLIHLLFLRI